MLVLDGKHCLLNCLAVILQKSTSNLIQDLGHEAPHHPTEIRILLLERGMVLCRWELKPTISGSPVFTEQERQDYMTVVSDKFDGILLGVNKEGKNHAQLYKDGTVTEASGAIGEELDYYEFWSIHQISGKGVRESTDSRGRPRAVWPTPRARGNDKESDQEQIV